MRFDGGAFINCLNFLRRLKGLALDETKAGERKDTQVTRKQLFDGLNSRSSEACPKA